TLLAARAALSARIEHATAAPPAGALKTRIHGDYHLGQVLLTKNDFVIVDFEGEPARSVALRRAKQSPLRDVAGMLRSFAYASASALRLETLNDDERAALRAPAAVWEAQTRAAFMNGYTASAGGGMLDADAGGASGLLPLFELQKALYELRYELTNRPEWVGIPLAGILALVASG
ncbi:MAG TPA: alpha-amylase, partial [Burkholderiaceae bacterium]|nr:alpha-amylase [Burkholderiaceae bacterium]